MNDTTIRPAWSSGQCVSLDPDQSLPFRSENGPSLTLANCNGSQGQLGWRMSAAGKLMKDSNPAGCVMPSDIAGAGWFIARLFTNTCWKDVSWQLR
jgi:hypothetical protein